MMTSNWKLPTCPSTIKLTHSQYFRATDCYSAIKRKERWTPGWVSEAEGGRPQAHPQPGSPCCSGKAPRPRPSPPPQGCPRSSARGHRGPRGRSRCPPHDPQPGVSLLILHKAAQMFQLILAFTRASLIAQLFKNPPATQEKVKVKSLSCV